MGKKSLLILAAVISVSAYSTRASAYYQSCYPNGSGSVVATLTDNGNFSYEGITVAGQTQINTSFSGPCNGYSGSGSEEGQVGADIIWAYPPQTASDIIGIVQNGWGPTCQVVGTYQINCVF